MSATTLIGRPTDSGKRWRGLIACVALVCSTSCSWFPESSFTVAPESRFPRWINVDDADHSGITVTVDFYGPLFSDAFARVTVVGRDGKARQHVDAVVTSAVGVQTADGAPARGEFPNYQVAAAGGVTDIFEQRKATNVLYMCDDPAVWAKLAPKASPPTSVHSKQEQAPN